MPSKSNTKSKSNKSRDGQIPYSLIPQDVLDETRQRFEQLQERHGRPFSRSSRELLAQNSVEAVKQRLKRVGISGKQARAAARAVCEKEIFSRESFAGASEMNVFRAERILGGVNNLIDVRFLLTGAERTAAVGRIRLGGGFATGFLVAPGVVMTNWHVFGRRNDARDARIEFGFRELNRDGRLATPTTFGFDVNRLFFSDEDHDVAIVALGERMRGNVDAESIPFCSLVSDADAVIAGELINVIQHPAGEPKQVALRDNTVVAVVDEMFIQYRADTKRGSSGSPVFTDEWELVGLHHAGVPETNSDGRALDINGNVATRSTPDDRISWIANEAIHSSALFRLLGNERFQGEEEDLVDSILNPPERSESRPVPPIDDSADPRQRRDRPNTIGRPSQTNQMVDSDGTIRLTVPVEFSVRLGDLAAAQAGGATGESELASLLERFSIDDDYSTRNGYVGEFLETDVPLPGLSDDQLDMAAQNREPIDGDDPHVLRYHNFSVVMNGERRIPFYTAVNIHGGKLIRISRDDDGGEHPWRVDRRIGSHEQTNNSHYKGRTNRLDRGHLVRRLDPGWGCTEADSARGIVDTFHYSNCAPQYDTFNRRRDTGSGPANGLWLGLENFIFDNAETSEQKVSVFSGPVFRDDDPDFKDNGVRIPTQYWKIVAWCDDDDELHAAAFLLTQKSMLDDDRRIERLADEEAFDFRERELFQTTVAHIAELTGLDFGPLQDDIDEGESFGPTEPQPIDGLDDILLS